MKVEIGDSSFVPQPGVLAEIPSHARYLTFRRRASAPNPRDALERLADPHPGLPLVFGLGASLVRELGAEVPGLREFPASSGPGFTVPSTPGGALGLAALGRSAANSIHETRRVEKALAGCLRAGQRGGRVPLPERASTSPATRTEPRTRRAPRRRRQPSFPAGAPVSTGPRSRRCSSGSTTSTASSPSRHETQDHIIGRRKSDNVELRDGPDAAHVQRTEQEAPEPPIFLLRRSMPWADARRAGLVFVAFGNGLDAFEYHLSRMTGAADRIADHLFRFTRPVTGAYFWCPPHARTGAPT